MKIYLHQLAYGLSDHTEGIEIAIAAVALGASIIEKHLTLDNSLEGPDHKASITPDDFKRMVQGIRKIEIALGSEVKEPTQSELKNREIARKSIVANKNIFKGEKFTKDNLSVKRPGTGLTPMKWYEVLGTVAKKDFKENEMIEI